MELTAKLQIRPDAAVLVVVKPADIDLPDLPEWPSPSARTTAEATIGFVLSSTDLPKLTKVYELARLDLVAWVAYPKGGQLDTDLNRDSLAAALVSEGLRPVRQVAIDDVWSALRFRPA